MPRGTKLTRKANRLGGQAAKAGKKGNTTKQNRKLKKQSNVINKMKPKNKKY
jgi:hypothetical protein